MDAIIYKNTKGKMNSMKNLVNDESEYIKYATIALLNERDRRIYGRYSVEKCKAVCSFCGIVYYTNISKECPLCEAKRLFLAGVKKSISMIYIVL